MRLGRYSDWRHSLGRRRARDRAHAKVWLSLSGGNKLIKSNNFRVTSWKIQIYFVFLHPIRGAMDLPQPPAYHKD